MINVAIFENQMQESLVSLVTGSPNLWITKDRSPINGQDRVFVNQAEIIQSDIQARSSRLVFEHSGVHNNWDKVFFKILKEPSLMQK